MPYYLRYSIVFFSFSVFFLLAGCGNSIEKKINRMGYEADGIGLIEAVKNNDTEAVKLFIENKTPLNFADTLGATAVFHAAKLNDSGILQLLIKSGAEIMITDNGKKTPLHYAIENGSENNVKILLEQGSDISWRDNYGRDALLILFASAPEENINVFNMLLDKKADINTRDKDRKTPLIIAVERNFPEYTKILISLKAGALAKDFKGKTALDYAEEKLEKKELTQELFNMVEEYAFQFK